jgi:uncharacterized surface protein with fasciclin (FAS1) repeats
MDQSKGAPAGGEDTHTQPTKNILDAVIGAGHFTFFASAVHAAGITDALGARGPFTVFAPTDEAFKKLPAGAYDSLLRDVGKLKAVLNYHVVLGSLATSELKSGDLMTLQGSPLTAAVSSSDVRVNRARVSTADIVATNGIVHAIDTLLLPKKWRLLAAVA